MIIDKRIKASNWRMFHLIRSFMAVYFFVLLGKLSFFLCVVFFILICAFQPQILLAKWISLMNSIYVIKHVYFVLDWSEAMCCYLITPFHYFLSHQHDDFLFIVNWFWLLFFFLFSNFLLYYYIKQTQFFTYITFFVAKNISMMEKKSKGNSFKGKPMKRIFSWDK